MCTTCKYLRKCKSMKVRINHVKMSAQTINKPIALANPKSHILTTPLFEIRILSGLMFLCNTFKRQKEAYKT